MPPRPFSHTKARSPGFARLHAVLLTIVRMGTLALSLSAEQRSVTSCVHLKNRLPIFTYHCGHRLGGDTFAPAGKAQLFGGGGFDVYPVSFDL